jgi:natural product biosynthesis luciferase-like monooxygenase protein
MADKIQTISATALSALRTRVAQRTIRCHACVALTPAMRFGLNFFPSFRPTDLTTAEYFDQVLRLSARADQLGYHSVKAVEHYFHDYGGQTPNPIVLLSAIAVRTRRLRPITGAVIPAFNHPVKLAGELAMLDNISQGRLDVGFGRAFIPEEFEVFGVSMEESRARFEEGLEIVRRLWTEERVTFEGKFHSVRNVRSTPRPVQKPHPPIWIAAVMSEESFVAAGARGFNLMIVPYAGSIERSRDLLRAYRRAWRDAGHPPGAEQVQVSLHCYLAETHREAIEEFRRPLERYVEVFSEALGSWAGYQSSHYAGYQKMVEGVISTTPDSILENRTALVGSPAEVIEQLEFLCGVFGEVEPSLQINFGGLADREAFRTLELFARHVMPRFR